MPFYTSGGPEYRGKTGGGGNQSPPAIAALTGGRDACVPGGGGISIELRAKETDRFRVVHT